MANITNGRQIRTDDFAVEDRQLVQKLAFQLNPFISEVSNALQSNLTIAENLDAEYKIVNIKVDASGIPIGNNRFSTKVKAQGTQVVRTIGATFPTSGPSISFVQRGNIIEIQHVTGLVAGVDYSLTVLILG
jgi:hypothetical protein